MLRGKLDDRGVGGVKRTRKHDRQRERLHRRVEGTPPQKRHAPVTFQALDGTMVTLPPFLTPKPESKVMSFGGIGLGDDDEHWLERRDDGRWYEVTKTRAREIEAELGQGEGDE